MHCLNKSQSSSHNEWSRSASCYCDYNYRMLMIIDYCCHDHPVTCDLMSPSRLLKTISLAPGTPHLLVLQAVSCIFLLNHFHLFFCNTFFKAPIFSSLFFSFWSDVAVQIIPHMWMQLLIWDDKSISSAWTPMDSRCTYLAVSCVSPSGQSKSSKKKLIIS